MKKLIPLVFPALLLFSVSATAQQKAAGIKGTCKSLILHDVSWFHPSVGAMTTGFTTYDGTPDLLYTDYGSYITYSRELKPRSGQPGVFETDYATVDSDGYISGYGSGTFSMPTPDVDGNGIPDFMQVDMAANYSASGSLFADYPQASTSTLSGTFSKAANSTITTYSAKIKTGTEIIDYTGVFETSYVSGGISYSRKPNKLAISVSQTQDNATYTYTGGNISFSVNNPNQFSLAQFVVTANDGSKLTIYPATFNRIGNKYIAHFEVDDAEKDTHWRDYSQWVFELIDSNDWDGDGIPDLTDNPPVAPVISKHPPGRVINLGSPTTFRVTASGYPAPSFQWKKNGVAITGATTTAFTIAAAQLSDAGNYTVLVRNLAGQQLSIPATLVVCGYSLSSSYQLVNDQGGSNSVSLTTSGPCGWSVRNTNDWITFPQLQGSGPTLLEYHVAPNTSTIARSGFVNISGKTLVVNQLGTPSPSSAGINGRTIVFTVTGSSGGLPSNDTYLFTTSISSDAWRQVTVQGQQVAFGTFDFQRVSDTLASLALGNGNSLNLTFATASSGQALFSAAGGGTQTGSFVMSKSKPDYNSDGFSDLLWQHTNATVKAWFMQGNTYQGVANIKKLGVGWRVVAQSDVNRDGHSDLILQHQDFRLAVWLLNETNYVSAVPLTFPGTGLRLVGMADFNSDERDDFVFKNSTGVLSVRFLNGTLITGSKIIRDGVPLPAGFNLAQVADLNRDGQIDLLLQHSDGRIVTWFMNGTDLISSLLVRKAAIGWNLVGASDINFDGHSDLLLYNNDGRTAAWLLNDSSYLTAFLLSNGQLPNPALKLVGPK